MEYIWFCKWDTFDLGVSSVHLDNPERGFSFNKNANLDMRFDQSGGKTASEYINTLSEVEIEDILRTYGQERYAKGLQKILSNSEKIKILLQLLNL